MLGDDALQQRPDRGLVGHVEQRRGQTGAAFLPQPGQARLAAVGGVDPRAASAQFPAQGIADAGGAAGDDGGPAAEWTAHGLSAAHHRLACAIAAKSITVGGLLPSQPAAAAIPCSNIRRIAGVASSSSMKVCSPGTGDWKYT